MKVHLVRVHAHAHQRVRDHVHAHVSTLAGVRRGQEVWPQRIQLQRVPQDRLLQPVLRVPGLSQAASLAYRADQFIAAAAAPSSSSDNRAPAGANVRAPPPPPSSDIQTDLLAKMCMLLETQNSQLTDVSDPHHKAVQAALHAGMALRPVLREWRIRVPC